MTLIMQYSIFSYRERRRDGRPRMAWHGPKCEDAESRQLWRHQQLVSLRRHYPRQVLGRSPRLPLSPFELPFGCAFIMAAPADKRVDACGCWVSGERAVAVRQVEDCRAVDSRLGGGPLSILRMRGLERYEWQWTRQHVPQWLLVVAYMAIRQSYVFLHGRACAGGRALGGPTVHRNAGKLASHSRRMAICVMCSAIGMPQRSISLMCGVISMRLEYWAFQNRHFQPAIPRVPRN